MLADKSIIPNTIKDSARGGFGTILYTTPIKSPITYSTSNPFLSFTSEKLKPTETGRQQEKLSTFKN